MAPFSMFMKEFSGLINSVSLCVGRLLIAGDFNIHWDLVDHHDTTIFRDLLESYDWNREWPLPPTSVVILLTLWSLQCLVKSTVVSEMVTDHFAIQAILDFQNLTGLGKLFSFGE